MIEQNRDGSISDSSFWLSWKSFIILITAVTLITAGYAYAIKLYIPEPQEAGTFGDSFGALTSLFTAFAFAGLIFTLFIQKNELSLQRKEFQNLVNEQRGSKEQLEQQFIQMSKDSYERTFFSILNNFNSTRLDFSRESFTVQGPKELHGNAAFSNALHFLKPEGKVKIKGSPEYAPKFESRKDFSNIISELQEKFSNQDNSQKYLLQLEVILKYLEKWTIEDKEIYFEMLRSTACKSELGIISLGIALEEHKNLKDLVLKYDILRHFSTWDIFPPFDGPNPYLDLIKGSNFHEALVNRNRPNTQEATPSK